MFLGVFLPLDLQTVSTHLEFAQTKKNGLNLPADNKGEREFRDKIKWSKLFPVYNISNQLHYSVYRYDLKLSFLQINLLSNVNNSTYQ